VALDRAPSTGIHGPDEQQDDAVVTRGSRDEAQQIASGRPSATPFALVGVVAVTIAVVVSLVVAIVFLVFWLA
jgi:hypothetical protein